MNDDSERIRFVQACRPAALAGMLLLASGCAALTDGLSPAAGTNSSPIGTVSLDQPRAAAAEPASSTSADSIAAPSPSDVIAQAVPATESKSELEASAKVAEAQSKDAPPKDAPEDFYDPFAKKEDSLAAGEDYDPWEGFNSAMFQFNRKFDRYVLKPVAKVYDKVVPDALQKGISNFYYNNIHFGPRLLNNVFQLKFKGAGIELSRFLINNVIGLAGFFDPAKHWLELETPQEDTGQTLGAYGVPPGPYLVLPLLPPFTLRDFFGYLLDFGMNPVNYFLLPTFEVDNWPSAIAHKNRDTTTILQLGRTVEDIVNYRSLNLETFEGVEEATVDLYSAVRNAYLQKRAKAVRE
jgi:phospholipid-binding lipoprotein MlaA